MVATIISFPSFTVNHNSVYIVQGLESFSFYHAIQALEKGGGERKFLLFIPKSFLSLSILNYEEWTNCKKATLDEKRINEINGKIFGISFDVDTLHCKAEYDVLNVQNEEDVKSAVDKKEMFIFDENILKVNESVFPLKFKKEKTKGLGFKEIRSLININTSHLLLQKTEKLKTKFLANTEEIFLTKVQILKKAGKKGSSAGMKDTKNIIDEVSISKRGRKRKSTT